MSDSRHYDFIAIGGGSAGFNFARTAREFSDSVAVIDGAKELGGLCILRGCMPSKTLLYTAEILHHARHGSRFGLDIPSAQPDMAAVIKRKREIIDEFAEYRVKQLVDSGRFHLYRQNGRFVGPNEIELADGTRLTGGKILISTGSVVNVPPIPGLSDVQPWTSDDVLDLDFVPESVIVLGGGIVACELAQYLNRMGTRVHQIQRSPHLLSDHSPEAAEVVAKAFRDEGVELFSGTRITNVAFDGSEFEVTFEHRGEKTVRRALHLFNALGRSPNTSGLGLEAAGVKVGDDGHIIANGHQQTSNPDIYAGGDCTGPHEIVHIAVQQGELAARHAAGKPATPIDYNLLLTVVFTDPQLAAIGRSEEQLKTEGIDYLSASYPFDDHGKSILMEEKYGYVKVLAAKTDGKILGAEIVGKDAGELIHSFSVGMAMGATVRDMLRAPWYHPTLAEIITYPLEDIADMLD